MNRYILFYHYFIYFVRKLGWCNVRLQRKISLRYFIFVQLVMKFTYCDMNLICASSFCSEGDDIRVRLCDLLRQQMKKSASWTFHNSIWRLFLDGLNRKSRINLTFGENDLYTYTNIWPSVATEANFCLLKGWEHAKWFFLFPLSIIGLFRMFAWFLGFLITDRINQRFGWLITLA